MNRKENLIGTFLFLIFTAIYFFGSFSKIPFGDCIGFVLYPEKGNFIFSTGTYAHFLFSNTLVLFKKIFPFFESWEVGKLVVIFSSVFSLLILYKILLKISKNLFSSFFGTVIFGFSFSFWKNSEIIEVYTYNMFWVGLLLFTSILFLLEKQKKYLFLGSLFLGISLYSHIQNILLIPAFFLLVFWSSDLKSKIYSLLIFCSLFLGLILVPIFNNDPVSSVFSSKVVAETLNFSMILKSFALAVGYLYYNFWYFIIFSVFGMRYLFKNNFKIFLFLLFSAIPVFIFSIIFRVSDNYVYFIPFNFIIAIFIGIGIFSLVNKNYTKILAISAVCIPAFYFMSFNAASYTDKGKNFDQQKSYKGGLSYYLLPWMNDNVGILEFTIEKRKSPDVMTWMTKSADEFIEIRKSKGDSTEMIKKF